MSRQVYRAPLAVGVRGFGVGVIGLGVALIGAVLVRAADPGGAVAVLLWVTVAIVGLVSLLVFATGAARLAGWRTRLVLDESGFVNATGPGAGVRRGAWRDVRKVQADGPVVSVDLAGTQQSVIRTELLDVEPRELARELRARLNQNRGYTPLGSAGVGRPAEGEPPAEPEDADGGSA